jgi:hypothetical protein
MAPDARTEVFNMRLTPLEVAMLRALAEDSGLAAADLLRTCIRREYKERFGNKPPKKSRS